MRPRDQTTASQQRHNVPEKAFQFESSTAVRSQKMLCCRRSNPRHSHYRLLYFDVRGSGEAIRMIFHYEEVPFADVRLTVEEWAEYKQQSRAGMLPELKVDDKFVITQSHAIARFLGNLFGLNGKSEWDRAMIDEYSGVLKDFVKEMNPYLFVLIGRAPGDKKKLRKTVFLPTIHRMFPEFTKIITESGSGFLLKSGLSWVDFFYCEYLYTIHNLEPTSFKKHKELLSYIQRIHSLPTLADYIKIRPSSDV